MEPIPQNFTEAASLRDKVRYVLNVLHKASADEVAMEVMELQGIASEEGVAALTIDVEEELQQLMEEGLITAVKEHRQKKRFSLVAT
ncbi:MAG TPA: hypothetical protein VD794_07235 [Flavisolibacter sp.]|nr:hypothetical protein [Flavisolibacter sp.]